jgi:hypothetical protein
VNYLLIYNILFKMINDKNDEKKESSEKILIPKALQTLRENKFPTITLLVLNGLLNQFGDEYVKIFLIIYSLKNI